MSKNKKQNNKAAPVVEKITTKLPRRLHVDQARVFSRGEKGAADTGTKTHWRKMKGKMTRKEFLARFS